MGFLDNLKDKAGDVGDKAKEGLGTAREKAADLVEDVKDRLDGDEDTPEAATGPRTDADYSPAAVDEAAGGISEPAAGASEHGTVHKRISPRQSGRCAPTPIWVMLPPQAWVGKCGSWPG